MLGPTLFVPWSVLRHADLRPAQKRLWAVLAALGQSETEELCQVLGCRRETAYRHLAKLDKCSLVHRQKLSTGRYRYSLVALQATSAVEIPMELIFDSWLGGEGVLIWAAIAGGTRASPSALASTTGLDRGTVRPYLRRLAAGGWLLGNQARNLYAQLRHEQAEVDELDQEIEGYLNRGLSYGQALMTVFIAQIVEDDDFKIEADEPFLKNPIGTGTMRYDLYYEKYGVAFEFHGPQHFYPTKNYPSLKAFAERQARDVFKLGLSAQQEIKVWVLTARDLTYKRLNEITVGLPQRDLSRKQHLVAHLEALAAEHADWLAGVPAVVQP